MKLKQVLEAKVDPEVITTLFKDGKFDEAWKQFINWEGARSKSQREELLEKNRESIIKSLLALFKEAQADLGEQSRAAKMNKIEDRARAVDEYADPYGEGWPELGIIIKAMKKASAEELAPLYRMLEGKQNIFKPDWDPTPAEDAPEEEFIEYMDRYMEQLEKGLVHLNPTANYVMALAQKAHGLPVFKKIEPDLKKFFMKLVLKVLKDDPRKMDLELVKVCLDDFDELGVKWPELATIRKSVESLLK